VSPATARGAWARAAGLLAVVVAADQATKALVRADLERGQSSELVPGVLELVHGRNSGVAFGFLQGRGSIVVPITVVAICALLAYFARHARTRLAWVPTGLLLGGALGNGIDRVRDGAVTDFIDFALWPAFNVADSAITLGVIALLVVVELDARARPG